MGVIESMQKASPIDYKTDRTNKSDFKKLIDRNTELVDENKELKEEIKRLNNNWNELEKILLERKETSRYANDVMRFTAYDYILEELKKLKESNKNIIDEDENIQKEELADDLLEIMNGKYE